MRTHLSVLLTLALSLGGVAAEPASRRDPALRQTPIVEAVRRCRDAVVNIHSERTVRGASLEDLFALSPAQSRVNGMGTGLVIDPRGYIITNQHVVDEVNSLRIRLADGTSAPARVLGRDTESDLALIKIDVSHPLPTIPLGTSSDLMVGEPAIAIGNAYGYEHTVTVGHVSAIGRDVTLNKEMAYKQLIQTDAAINPGNSGGPLVNVYGELIGVNVAIRAGAQNIGFAIPVDTMIRVAAALMANQSRRGGAPAHGLTVRDEVRGSHDNTDAPLRQVVIDRVEQNGPGDKAALRRGDVLLRVGDVPVSSSLDLERALLDRAPGEHVAVVVHRAGGEQRAELVLAARAVQPISDVVWRKLGLRLQTVSTEAVTRVNGQLHGGMAVMEVRPDSAAAKAGLQRGDILVGLHQWEMLSMDNVLFVLNHPDLPTFNPIRFYLLRGGQVHRGWLHAAD
jgi:serine protease Do